MMRCLAALLVLTLTISAQTLRVDGVPGAVSLPVGSSSSLDLETLPNQPTWLALNTSPGPSVLGGFVIPVAIDAQALFLLNGVSLPGGTWSLPFTLPMDPGLVGATFYAAAATLDPSAPGGLGISNGAAVTVVLEGADAGPDGLALVGEGVTLDGAASTLVGNPTWAVVDGPAGAAAVLEGDNTLTPVFSTDLPGRYTVALQTSGAMGVSGDHVVVDVFDIVFTGPVDGSFGSGSVDVMGSVDGPGPYSASFQGNPLPLTNGQFSVLGHPLTGTSEVLRVRVDAGARGSIDRAVTVWHGMAAPVGALASPAAALRVGGVTLDALEVPLEMALAQVQIGALLTSVPPIPVLPSGFVTATVTITGATYNPNVDVDIYPSNGAIGFALTVNNLVLTSDVTGAIFGFPYNETATITADSVRISADMVLGSNAMGALEVTLMNEDATFTNFNLTATGALGGLTQLGAITSGVQAVLETAFEGLLAIVPTTINPLLGSVSLTNFDLGPYGVPATVSLPLNSVVYDPAGLTLATDFSVMPNVVSPTAPALSGVWTTMGGVPAFGATTPVNAAVYDLALAVNDDLINQLLAATLLAGGLDVVIEPGSPLYDPSFTAGGLGALMPQAGFDRFDAMTPMRLVLTHTTAPVVTLAAGTGAAATLHLANARLAIEAEVAPGRYVPALVLAVDAEAGLDVQLDPVAGSLTLTPTTIAADFGLTQALPGTDPAPALSGLATLLPTILGGVTGPIATVPLPSLGGTGAVIVEVSVDPLTPDTLAGYADLP